MRRKYRRHRKMEYHLIDDDKKKITPEMVREAFSWIFYTIIAVVIAAMFSFAFGKTVNVVGNSMEPTLNNGQTVLINRVNGYLKGTSRGDLVAFLPNGNTNLHYYIKRVVAIPGETVQIKGGILFVNGVEQTKDAKEFDKMEDAGIASSPIKLKEDEYFVLGDSRNSSEDSRSANVGVVKASMIIGNAWYVYGGNFENKGFIHNNYLTTTK
ncbi:signal peptidase I [Butyrivibrio sp. NC3005]|uniref:signal peptidase I n=1 Tax=Butyrivibrio sp. NC3005 TaxID=1280685 RepID=UPI00040FE904|nr:signal peptidase I [Butyrivibrio sp. NC3005]